VRVTERELDGQEAAVIVRSTGARQDDKRGSGELVGHESIDGSLRDVEAPHRLTSEADIDENADGPGAVHGYSQTLVRFDPVVVAAKLETELARARAELGRLRVCRCEIDVPPFPVEPP
jgi:hypothetical protein